MGIYCKQGPSRLLRRSSYTGCMVRILEPIYSDHQLENFYDESSLDGISYYSTGRLKNAEYRIRYQNMSIVKTIRNYFVDEDLIECEVISISKDSVLYPVIIKIDPMSDNSPVLLNTAAVQEFHEDILNLSSYLSTDDLSDTIFNSRPPNRIHAELVNGRVLPISHTKELNGLWSIISQYTPGETISTILSGMLGGNSPETVYGMLSRESPRRPHPYIRLPKRPRRKGVILTMDVNHDLREGLVATLRYNRSFEVHIADGHISGECPNDICDIAHSYIDGIRDLHEGTAFSAMTLRYDNDNEMVRLVIYNGNQVVMEHEYDLIMVAILHPDLNLQK